MLISFCDLFNIRSKTLSLLPDCEWIQDISMYMQRERGIGNFIIPEGQFEREKRGETVHCI